MLLSRCRTQVTVAVSALSRLSTSAVAALGPPDSNRIRFGKFSREARNDRRRSVAPANEALPRQQKQQRTAQQQAQRKPGGEFEFGALARVNNLVAPERDHIGLELDLELEQAADSMVEEAAASQTPVIDDDSKPGHRPLGRSGRKHDEAWYLRRIDKLAEAGDTGGIVRLLHRDMIGEDRYLPTRAIMHTIMRHLGSIGAYEECKVVLNRCKSAGVEVNHISHCQYLNALAKAPISGRPNPAAGELAYKYYDALCRDSDTAEQHRFVYYFAALACGRNGLVQEAFKIFDDSVTIGRQHPLPQMLDALLEASCTDRAAGSAVALLAWRRFRLAFGTRPLAWQYLRLLRCLRHCGLGPSELLAGAEALAGPPTRAALPGPGAGTGGASGGRDVGLALRQLQDGWSAELDQRKLNPAQGTLMPPHALPTEMSLPAQPPAALALSSPLNLLQLRQPTPRLPNNALQLPWQRLTLVGGLTGLAQAMRADGVEPTLEICLELMELLPPLPEAERALMRLCRNHGLHRAPAGGSPLYNALLRYRVRHRLECDDVLDEMHSVGLRADRGTYVALAGACDSRQAGERHLADMARDSACPDQGVFCAMLQASRPTDLDYKAWLLRRMSGFDVPPSPAFVRRMEADLAVCRSALVGGCRSPVPADSVMASAALPVDADEFQRFRAFYESWLKSNELFSPKENIKYKRLLLKSERVRSLKA